MNLYEIDQSILALIDPETGEICDYEAFEALQMEKDAKVEGLVLLVKNLQSDIRELREEEKTLAGRRKTKENNVERLMECVCSFLNGSPLETAKFKVSFRKTEKTVIDDITKIPKAYLNYGDPTADKNAIKAAIKAGETIEGAHVEETNSMSIK
jgi:hypothetical protein